MRFSSTIIARMTAKEKTAAKLEKKVIAADNQVENNIYFALGGVTVSSRERVKLQQHAAYLKENPETSVTLIGFTDDLGSRLPLRIDNRFNPRRS